MVNRITLFRPTDCNYCGEDDDRLFIYKHRKTEHNFYNVSPEGFVRWGSPSLSDEAFRRNVVETVSGFLVIVNKITIVEYGIIATKKVLLDIWGYDCGQQNQRPITSNENKQADILRLYVHLS